MKRHVDHFQAPDLLFRGFLPTFLSPLVSRPNESVSFCWCFDWVEAMEGMSINGWILTAGVERVPQSLLSLIIDDIVGKKERKNERKNRYLSGPRIKQFFCRLGVWDERWCLNRRIPALSNALISERRNKPDTA